MYPVLNSIAANMKDEAEAIAGYTNLLCIAQDELDPKDFMNLYETVSEIISDELNHVTKLQVLYSLFSDIEAGAE